MNKSIMAGCIIFTFLFCALGQDYYPVDSGASHPTYISQESIQQNVKSIIAKDPWRAIDGLTNYVLEKNWVEFQGEVIEERDDFIIFKGTFGEIGEVVPSIQGTVKNIDMKATSRSDSNNKLKENYNGSLNTRSSGRNFTNSQNGYGQVTGANGSGHYNATDQTVIQQENNQSETTVQKGLKNYGEDLFIVVNFPFPLEIKHEFEQLVAKRSGYQTYTNSHGRKVTLPKLDYGVPCEKIWSKQELDALRDQIEAPQKEAEKREIEAAVNRQQAENIKIKQDIELAGKGDRPALRRMGDRYKNGVGVEKDLSKAEKYYKRAEELLEQEATQQAKDAAAQEQAGLKQRFLRNLDLADNHDNVGAALFVEKCYREGIGTEKDLIKADAYHAKAVSLGIPAEPNTRSY